MLSQCFVRYANTVLVSMTQEIKNISKRKDEGVGKKSFRYLFCWPVNNLFLLIRSHQHPRLVSLVVNISLLTSQTLFFNYRSVVVVFYDDSESSLSEAYRLD